MDTNTLIRKVRRSLNQKKLQTEQSAVSNYVSGVHSTAKDILKIVEAVLTTVQRVEKQEGPKGEKGDQGERGEAGLDGSNGVNGKDGRDGKDGKQGPKGEIGPRGPRGLRGKDGVDGKNGRDGKDGKDGSPDTAVDIRDKLSTLRGRQRLDAKHIKNLPVRGGAIINGGVSDPLYRKIYIQSVAPSNPEENDLWIVI